MLQKDRLEDVAHRWGSQHPTRSPRACKERRTHGSALGHPEQTRKGAMQDGGQGTSLEESVPKELSDACYTNIDPHGCLEAGGLVRDTQVWFHSGVIRIASNFKGKEGRSYMDGLGKTEERKRAAQPAPRGTQAPLRTCEGGKAEQGAQGAEEQQGQSLRPRTENASPRPHPAAAPGQSPVSLPPPPRSLGSVRPLRSGGAVSPLLQPPRLLQPRMG